MKKIISIIISAAFLLTAIVTIAGICGKTNCGYVVETIHGGRIYTGNALEDLKEQGVIEGYDDGQLHPELILTRAQFAKIMTKAFPDGINEGLMFHFTDLSEDHWAYGYIQKAVDAGWIKGFPDKTVRPDDDITFEQATAVVCRVIGIASEYDDYPEDYISAAIDYSITDGVNSVIGESISRDDAAKIIINAQNYLSIMENEETLENAMYSGSKGYGMTPVPAPSVNGVASKSNSNNMPLEEGLAADTEYYYETVEPVFPGYFNTEEYNAQTENIFKDAATSPLSTFSIDADTASYSNMRRFILNGQRIPEGSIRSEELINYFDYTKAETEDGKPFGVNYTVSKCPWNDNNMLAMITVSGEELTVQKPSNIVFLIDTSGSMYDFNKLPLVKMSLSMLLDKLGDEDTVSIVTYASGTGVALEPTRVSEKEKILNVMNGLYASGGTYGEGGIQLAYQQAEKFKIDGNNRIILCTDGDFNIGQSSEAELDKLISEHREKGIFLSVLGFGMGNYKDNKMETLADKGNGNYAYIDNLREAKKVLVDDMSKTIYTIAKDVKIQTEFNPATVSKYRLIGYENRQLNNEDFDNDKKDAGELGAGATVTVLYELVPASGETQQQLKYQTTETTGSSDLMTVKIRYKEPEGSESILSEYPVNALVTEPTGDFKFASAVAELGMILNDSEFKGNATLDSVIELAREGVGEDAFGLRAEFIQLADLLRYRDTINR
ncbi:MAG: von Willebrand factor type A domain-containing protein [Clostridia bacterium]|nr:von Willebrand factor type A domain-containing protein [Clostridia bacterium]